MKTQVKVAYEDKHGIRAKIDMLYPAGWSFDSGKTAEARSLIEASLKSGDDAEKHFAHLAVNEVVMRAVKDATEQGPYNLRIVRASRAKAMDYFTSVGTHGTQAEKGAARIFLENVLAREIAKPSSQINKYAVEGAHAGIVAIRDPGAVGMLREAAKKVKACEGWGMGESSMLLRTADNLEVDSRRVPAQPSDFSKVPTRDKIPKQKKGKPPKEKGESEWYTLTKF